jgi:endoglucanase
VLNEVVAADAGATTYQAAGLQSLVTAIRGEGNDNLIVLGGLSYSNDLSEWVSYVPSDPAKNIAASWHVYNYNPCISPSCWNGAPAGVAALYPLLATEIGEGDCASTFVNGGDGGIGIMEWLDGMSSGYLAWAWDAYGEGCSPMTQQSGGNPYSLITNYASGTPNGAYPQAVHDHIAGL